MNSEDKLQQIRENYARELPGEVSDVYKFWQQVLNNPENDQALNALFQVCHKLAGTGACFGYTLLSEHAGEIERFLLPMKEQHENLKQDEMDRISDLVKLLPDDARQVNV